MLKLIEQQWEEMFEALEKYDMAISINSAFAEIIQAEGLVYRNMEEYELRQHRRFKKDIFQQVAVRLMDMTAGYIFGLKKNMMKQKKFETECLHYKEPTPDTII